MTTEAISKFIEDVTIPLKYDNKSEGDQPKPWVFWDANASSDEQSIDEALKSAFSNVGVGGTLGIIQFWASLGTDGLLSVSGPFAVTVIDTSLAIYRKQSLSNEIFKTDVNDEQNQSMLTPGPVPTFVHCLPCVKTNPLDDPNLEASIMLPVDLASEEEYGVGVVEVAATKKAGLGDFILHLINEMKKVGVKTLGTQNLMSCMLEKIDGLKPTVDIIEEGLKVLCDKHDLILGQVWMARDMRSTKETLALKLTGFFRDDLQESYVTYYELCNEIPMTKGEMVVKTFEDRRSRFAPVFHSAMLENLNAGMDFGEGALSVCLTRDDGVLSFVFELVGVDVSNKIEPLLSTLKTTYPSFKFAEGEDLVCGRDVIVVVKSIDTEEKIRVFEGRMKQKASTKELTKAAIEMEFGKTIQEASKSLGVSERHLRTCCRAFGIAEWRGPRYMRKMKKSGASLEIHGEKEGKGGESRVEDNSTDEEVVTLKAKHGSDRIKFSLPIEGLSLAAIKIEIEKRLQGIESYTLKYMDPEDKEWYMMVLDDDIHEHIKSLKTPKKVIEISIESADRARVC